ncbi:MAG: hypothetical protein SFY56_00380 [Bacteroidota bacterium]|nr:hypothetical protein [Bacteroidota bacterium]
MTFRILIFIFSSTFLYGQTNTVQKKGSIFTLTSVSDKSVAVIKYDSFTIIPMDSSKTGLPADYLSRVAGESSISGIVTSINEMTIKNLNEIEDVLNASFHGSEIYIDLTDKYKHRSRNRTYIIWLTPRQ